MVTKKDTSEIINLSNIREKLSSWLEEMAKGLEPGRFRFCAEGSFVPTAGHAAQVSTCFAMKTAWQAGIWREWTAERKKACINFIQSFQREDGFFYDPWLANLVASNLRLKLRFLINFISGNSAYHGMRFKKTVNMRAETRQSASTLIMVGTKPKYPLPIETLSFKDVKKYIEFWDWRVPWSAGSHLSHLVFMLTVNKKFFGIPDNYDELIDYILQYIASVRDPKTGTWFKGNPSDYQKINGAMKIFTALQWLNRPYPDCQRLLDFALKQPFLEEGCGFLNRLFVVQQAAKAVPDNYRRDEIKALGIKALKVVKKFSKADGGFSFFINRSQQNYYGAKVSKGYKVSDLHGTTMIVWAIAIALDLLGENAPEGAQYWKCHKP